MKIKLKHFFTPLSFLYLTTFGLMLYIKINPGPPGNWAAFWIDIFRVYTIIFFILDILLRLIIRQNKLLFLVESVIVVIVLLISISFPEFWIIILAIFH